ncbi:MAG: hypothetical protein RL543_2 [Pseudomonadota bacterium]
MTSGELMDKAVMALHSARILFDAGDLDGACNRAYYALYDAARAALIATQAPPEVLAARTHSGVIAAFGLHIVKRGLIAAEHGRAFNRLHELRMIADYRGDSVEAEQIVTALSEADAFLKAVTQIAEAG